MEIDAPNDAFAFGDQTTTISVDPLDQAISFSPNNQRQLSVDLSQRNLLEDSTSEQSTDDDDDTG